MLSAAALGIRLAVENHADLTARQLETLIERAATESLGVCFDSANALRVGDEPLEALRRLAPHVLMVHLKDVEHTAEEPIGGPRSVPYGTGAVPVARLLDLLATRRFAGLVCVELGQLAPGDDEHALVADAVGWLQERETAQRRAVECFPSREVTAAGLALAAAVVLAVSSAFTKRLVGEFAHRQLIGPLLLLNGLLVVPFAALAHWRLTWPIVLLHGLSAATLVVGSFCVFELFSEGSTAAVAIAQAMAPMPALAFSLILLSSSVTAMQAFGAVTVTVGVLAALGPAFGAFSRRRAWRWLRSRRRRADYSWF